MADMLDKQEDLNACCKPTPTTKPRFKFEGFAKGDKIVVVARSMPIVPTPHGISLTFISGEFEKVEDDLLFFNFQASGAQGEVRFLLEIPLSDLFTVGKESLITAARPRLSLA